jgi:uncharacterized membrane protein
MNGDAVAGIKLEVAEIDRQIAELKRRRRALLEKCGAGRLSWGAIMAGAFGALLVGLGVIALFAANWDAIGREARAVIAVAPLLACGVVAVLASMKGWRTRLFWEPLGIFWCVAVAAGTCLVAQTYHVGGSLPALVLFVALLMLPAVWATRSVVAAVLWPVLGIVWGIASVESHGGGRSVALAAKSVAFVALSLPAYVAFLRSWPSRAALVSAQVIAGVVYSFGLGLVLCFTLPWMYAYAMEYEFVCVFWACSALVATAGRVFSLPAWGTVGAVVACGTSLFTPFFKTAEVYILALVIAGGIIVIGVAKMRLALANIGAVTFLWLVVGKFFASHAPFTLKGVVLIASGLALIVLNVALIRSRRKRRVLE